jgi:DNA-binding MarR family transcriptional regulator
VKSTTSVLKVVKPVSPKGPGKKQIEALSEFRYRLRCFLRFSEDAARAEGVTVLQYQLLLHVCGFPGREWATVGEIAERLQSHHHGAVALVSRCEEMGLVKRKAHPENKRQVQVHILPKGRKCLERIAALHRDQLPALFYAVQAVQQEDLTSP